MAISVGFIGVGNMGNPMAYNVLKAGFPMIVYDRNPQAMENLLQAGAQRAASAREVVEGAEIVLTSLPASPDVEAVYLEPGGLVDSAKPGTMLIDLSSVLPSTPRKIEPRAKARGRAFPGSAGQRWGQRCTRRHIGNHGGGRPRNTDARTVGAPRHWPEHFPCGSSGSGQHGEGDQQYDGFCQCPRHDGGGGARREGRARPDDDLRGGEGQQRGKQGARTYTQLVDPTAIRTGIQSSN